MKNKILKLNFGLLVLFGWSNLQATKMSKDITHSIPWIETRLAHAMTVEELAKLYYGSTTETKAILKMNKNINVNSGVLRKNMKVLIPVTSSFTDQPELLGWVQ